MAYATLEDLQKRMPQFVLTATSKPTLDASQVFIDDTQAQFDSVLDNLGYVTPVTGPKSLAQCREIVCLGAMAKVLFARAAAIGTDVALQTAERAWTQYENAIKALADGNDPRELSDAEKTPGFVEKPPSQGVISGNVRDDDGNIIEPRITMDHTIF